jgi:hypothetical protein
VGNDIALGTERVARELYPLAVRQARGRVVLQFGVIAAWCVLLAFAGFPRHWGWFTGLFAVGVVTTIYDVRWWMWLRRADPVEGFARLQARNPLKEGGAIRQALIAAVWAAALGMWWYFGGELPCSSLAR